MKVSIVGSRDFDNYEFMSKCIDEINKEECPISLIISGGAKGADSLAEKYAKEHIIPTKIYYPDWIKYGKRAAAIRNDLIVSESDRVVAFWDGNSRGTKMTIDFAKSQNKPLSIFLYSVGT